MATMPSPCCCYFCGEGMAHRSDHQMWEDASQLLVAESLDPADRLRIRRCILCGHEEVAS